MALGAQPATVVAMILRQGAVLIAAGIVLGLAGALLLRHEMTAMVFGIGTVDPLSYAAACGVLIALGARRMRDSCAPRRDARSRCRAEGRLTRTLRP